MSNTRWRTDAARRILAAGLMSANSRGDLMSRAMTLLLLLTWLLAVTASSAAQPVQPCSDSAYRQFDFWLGEWSVHKPDGTVGGTNSIKSEYGGCVLHERYTTPGGYQGESLNTFDAARKVWHQTWVDNSGMLLLLEGRLTDRNMVLEGQTLGSDGATTKHRITWTPNPDGTVRQKWESTDAKGELKVVFDGLYKRKQ